MCLHGKTHHTHQWTYIYKMKEKWRKTEKNKNYNKKLFRLLMQFFCFVLVVIWSKLPTSKIRLHLHISKKCIINHHFCFRFVSHKCNTNAIPNSVFVFFFANWRNQQIMFTFATLSDLAQITYFVWQFDYILTFEKDITRSRYIFLHKYIYVY